MVYIGFGLGLAYQPSCAGFVYHFDKRYDLANGICSSACSVGFVVFPSLMEALIANFGLNGDLQITSALMANVCVWGFLLRRFKCETDQNYEPIRTGTVKIDKDILMKQHFRKLKSQNVIQTSLQTLRKILNFLYSEEYCFCFKEFSPNFLYCSFLYCPTFTIRTSCR